MTCVQFMISFFTTPIVSSIDLAYGYVFAGCMVFATVFGEERC